MSPFFIGFIFTTVQHWITTRGFTGGIIIVFLLLCLCGLGLPLPEDVPLIISGAFLATDTRSWILAGLACWLGIMGGDSILYFMGRRYGMEITRVPFIGKHITRERIERVEKLFEKYGVGVVAIGRLFAGIRGAVVVCAGAIRFNYVKFIIADAMAAVVSGGLFMLLGHWIGEQLNDPDSLRRIREFKELFMAGGVIVALIFVLIILWSRRHRQAVEGAEVRLVTKVAAVEKKVTDTLVQTAGRIVRKPSPSEGGDPAPTLPSTRSDGAGARRGATRKRVVVLLVVLATAVAVAAVAGYSRRT